MKMPSSLKDWLSCADSLRNTDAIFVLAGREHRKQYALELFRQGFASRILFSVARFEIRRFSGLPLPVALDLLKLAADVPPPQRHYFVLFEAGSVQAEYVRPKRFGTLTEMEALAHWLDKNPRISSLLIISSATHLRRIGLCCRALLSANVTVRLIAAPDPRLAAQEQRQSADNSLHAALLEFCKVLLYSSLLAFKRNPAKNS